MHGNFEAQPLLIQAGAGTGKTCSVKQLNWLLAKALVAPPADDGVPLVPFIVYVQRIARMMRQGDSSTGRCKGSRPEGSQKAQRLIIPWTLVSLVWIHGCMGNLGTS